MVNVRNYTGPVDAMGIFDADFSSRRNKILRPVLPPRTGTAQATLPSMSSSSACGDSFLIFCWAKKKLAGLFVWTHPPGDPTYPLKKAPFEDDFSFPPGQICEFPGGYELKCSVIFYGLHLNQFFFVFGFQWIFSETFPSLTFPLKPLESWKGRASPIGGTQRQKQTSKSQMAIRPAGSHLRWLFWCFLFETYMAWHLFKLPFLVEFFFEAKNPSWKLKLVTDSPQEISADTRDPDTNSKRPWH